MIQLYKLRFVIFSVLFGLLLPMPSPVIAQDDPLIMGIFPRRNATTTIKFFTPMAKNLSVQLGREVKLETSKNFKTFWKGIINQRYDIVHFNQYHYIKTHKEFGYTVILKNEELGKSTVTGSIIVRKDSSFNTIADLKGKKIVFGGGPKAMLSYIFPTYLLRKGGLNKGDYIEVFAKTPPSAVKTVYFNQSDAGGTGDVVLYLPDVKKAINTDQLKFIARGKPYVHLTWAVNAKMNPNLIKKIQSSLVGLKDSEAGKKILKTAKLTGLVAATDDEFNPYREIVQEVLAENYFE